MADEKGKPHNWQHSWQLLDTAERLNRTFFLRRASAARPVWEPPVDVYESDRSIWIVVALPGVEAEHVELSVDGRDLVVAGERSRPRECTHMTVRRLEIPSGRFERRLEMPPGKYRVDSRELVDGCLVVRMTRL